MPAHQSPTRSFRAFNRCSATVSGALQTADAPALRYRRDVEADSFELLAASLRADSRDIDLFVEALADKLVGAFPESTRVERKGFRGGGRVHAIAVDIADNSYRLEREGQRVTCTHARRVRGITLSTTELRLDGWIQSLSRDLAETAAQSERGRIALERLLHE